MNEYTLEEFQSFYPQFDGEAVPEAVLEMYLELGENAVQKTRWRSYWKLAMGLFVAHFATLWAMGAGSPGSTAAEVIQAGEARGLTTSKSGGGISISKDYSAITSGLDGWAAWNQTQYGTQLATLSKMVGKGGMQIW